MDNPLNPSETAASPSDPEAPIPASTRRRPSRRLQRIRDYEEEALGRADPLSACLAANNAELMRINYRISKAVNATLASSPHLLDQLPIVYPALDMLARLNRQVQNFAELDVRVREASARAQQASTRRGGSREEINN